MRRLLVGLALALLLPLGTRADTVVCSATPQSPGTACSATSGSATMQLSCVCGSMPQASLLTGLTHYWTLDESSTGVAPVSRADSIGSMTLTDNATVASTAGKAGNAAVMVAASNEFLSHVDDASFTVTTGLTVSAWINPTTGVGYQVIASKWAGTIGAASWELGFGSATAVLLFQASDGVAVVSVSSTASLIAGNMQHVVVAYDGTQATSIGKVRLYINGVLRSSTSSGTMVTSLLDGTGAFQLGRRSNGVNNYGGVMDEVGFWSRALTPTEIACLYNAGTGSFYPYTGTCVR